MGFLSFLNFRKASSKKKVFYLPLTNINIKAKEKLESTLKSVTKDNTAALLVGINTQLPNARNSLVYADQIGEMLQRKAKQCGDVPLITYAEDTCLGVGFHMLSYGSVVLSNPNSFLGNIGFSITPWNLKEFAKQYQFKMQYINKGKNKIRLNRFEDFKQEDIDWIMNILNKRVDIITDHIISTRGSKIKDLETTRALLKSGDLILSSKAVELGLVDQLANPDEYVMQEFGKLTNIEGPQKNWKQKLGLETFADIPMSSEYGMTNLEQDMQEMVTQYFFENTMRCNLPHDI